jgi:mannose-6-phosphate isomerase class I
VPPPPILQNVGYCLNLEADPIAEALVQANQTLTTIENTLQGKLQEKQTTQKEIDRVYRLYVEEKLTPDQFGEFHKPLAERKKQLEGEALKLEAEIAHQKVNNQSADEILQESKNVYDSWPKLERAAKRNIVESITDNIIVGTDLITVNLKYLPSSEELTKAQRNLRGSSLRPT